VSGAAGFLRSRVPPRTAGATTRRAAAQSCSDNPVHTAAHLRSEPWHPRGWWASSFALRVEGGHRKGGKEGTRRVVRLASETRGCDSGGGPGTAAPHCGGSRYPGVGRGEGGTTRDEVAQSCALDHSEHDCAAARRVVEPQYGESWHPARPAVSRLGFDLYRVPRLASKTRSRALRINPYTTAPLRGESWLDDDLALNNLGRRNLFDAN